MPQNPVRVCWPVLFIVPRRLSRTGALLSTIFKIGDHVRWNSEAGRVTGKVIRVHKSDTEYKGYTHHASADDPQYEIKSDKTDRIAMHKGSALQKIE
jgi:Hypervirulence associated proteins TUDOR domain